MKILLLDDEQEVISSLERILRMQGHEVECYTSAEQAITPIQESAFDFALVDYLMPDNTGVWFMENARIPKQTKVILITAFVNRHVINRMFQLGACGYLVKPFDENDLKFQLEYHNSNAA